MQTVHLTALRCTTAALSGCDLRQSDCYKRSTNNDCVQCSRNNNARRLFQDILTGYNKLLRPVQNTSEAVTVKVKLRLSQLLDVHEKNQIITTNIWIKQIWTDCNLRWNPSEYGGLDVLHVPADQLWTPNIVLYNNADGKYQVNAITKALVHHNGTVVWEPPAFYKSSWTYDGFEVDLIHYDKDKEEITLENGRMVWIVANGVDLSDFLPSAEWDIMAVPVKRHEERYECCRAPYIDITFYVNAAVEIIPSTSLIIPLIGKYLLFTMVLVTLSIAVTVFTLNVHYRLPATHRFSKWIRTFFLEFLPKVLMMQRPTTTLTTDSDKRYKADTEQTEEIMMTLMPSERTGLTDRVEQSTSSVSAHHMFFDEEESMAIATAVNNTCFIANHFRKKTAEDEVLNFHYQNEVDLKVSIKQILRK
ncbi:Neurotransmitter-gated ion-channel ligand binding domain protein [Trichuris suis]|nr:Neurotransmitter-gated ion-channel ligand binding domain protein [Trichuris suis]